MNTALSLALRSNAALKRSSRNSELTGSLASSIQPSVPVSPGQYVLPQAYVEDMYRPDRFGRTGTGRVEVTAAKQ